MPRHRHQRNQYNKLPFITPHSLRRDLIWIDIEPLLQVERQKCEKVLREIDRAKSDLEIFQSQCVPAYSQWFFGKFGEQSTRLRELIAKGDELARLIDAVCSMAMISGMSERVAYHQLERERAEHLRKEQERIERGPNTNDRPGMGHSQSDSGSDDDFEAELEADFRRFAEFMESGFGGFGEDEDEDEDPSRGYTSGRDRESRKNTPTSKTQDSTPDGVRKKQLYRELARKLHPDVNSNLSPQQQTWWHEVQTAYDSGNLTQLETLAAMVEGGSPAIYLKVQSVSRLRAIFSDFHKTLKAAQASLRQARKDPSWNFVETIKNPVKLQALTKRMERELNQDIRALEREVEKFESQVERWKVPAKARGRRKAQRRRSDLDFE